MEKIDDVDLDTSNVESDELFQDIHNEKRWRLSYLKSQFQTLDLHDLFSRYLERISHGYFSQFLSLQIIVVTTHLITLASVSNSEDVLPDLILYGILLLSSIIVLIITDKYVKQHPKLLKYLSSLSFVLIFFTNFFIPVYYHLKYGQNLQPAYSTYIIICNYILLNVHNNNIIVAILLGIFISTVHVIVLIFITYRNSDKLSERIGAELIYLICLNSLGVYFRYMNEIVIRRSFLDRRFCVVTTNQLKYDEAQETQLMLSIIPGYIFDRVKKSHLIETQRRNAKLTDKLYDSRHENVTILFADIVNYTAMTTKLDIVQLLKTLNELFGRFDDASDDLNVLRIKFLGDCYYCVSGLPPNPCPHHAEACVDLGLKMIEIIEDVKQRRNLDINMRIGIHTGAINSGIIGHIKWQYDIWSADVDYANKMETDGEPGKVHITETTKKLLTKTYNIEPTDRGTYLISPDPKPVVLPTEIAPTPQNGDANVPLTVTGRKSIFKKRPSLGISHVGQRSFDSNLSTIAESSAEASPIGTVRRYSGKPVLTSYKNSFRIRPSIDRRLTHGDGKRRTAFMNTNIKRYKEGLEQTERDMRVKIEEMRLTKFEQWFSLGEMNRLFLHFKTWDEEKNFITAPDPLFRFYLVSELLLLICIYLIDNFTLSSWQAPSWPFYMTFALIIFIFLPLSWVHFLWVKFVNSDEPSNRFLRFYYNMSIYMTKNFIARFIVYVIVYVSFLLCVLSEWIDCEKIVFDFSLYQDNFLNLMQKSPIHLQSLDMTCIVPWHMTESCALAIIMNFLFLRMHMFIKLAFASVITIVYSVCVWYYSGNYYETSNTFNYKVKPHVSHILSVVILTVSLHLIDRQTEYMNRLDFLWYKKLTNQQKKSAKIRTENNKLLQNILPIHVAEIYLNLDQNISEDRLYREHYEDAAVIFASLTNYSVEDLGNRFLDVMNEIICNFDRLTIGNLYGHPIEKIKIAKWTYMAACGLAPGYGNARNIELDRQTHPVIAMIKFGANLMSTLKQLNRGIQQNLKLRIGISHGKLAAGVVGSKKPLYDIWGDPVNMASRMDTTGEVDKIQVLEETADVIKSFGYKCEYRGLVKVKGRSEEVNTYFVCMDNDFNLIETHQ